ncbi:hypothetical protein DFS33DRAFT_1482136 [Desarmillaria ectypa]|nr:hypothetical protein DFS33DRAFT_1269021 [Desarmillaria ectypa]KAK0212186.1 hypothetical protein DFS33DRAFT_1482136 [Desarmillaria ectypa]
MRFSVATLVPLAALAVPALSASVQARDGSYGGVDYKGKDGHNDGGSKDYDYGNKDYDNKDHGRKDCTWEPVFEHKNDFKGWNKGKYTPYDHKDVKKESYEIDCKDLCEKDDKCNSCQAYSKEETEEKFICELFEEIIDILTWEDDCDDDKDGKDGKYGPGPKKDDKDGKDDKDYKDGKDGKDGNKYYDTSFWNAHYTY